MILTLPMRRQVRLLRGGETIAVRPEHVVAAEEAELQRALAASSADQVRVRVRVRVRARVRFR